MNPSSTVRFLCKIAIFLVAFLFQSLADEGNDWEEEALLLYNSASPEINDLRGRSMGNERLKAYAKAMGILFEAPLREENALIAKTTLDALFESNPNDDVGTASAYYLARISHKYLDQPDLVAARSAYRYIFETYPGRFFGELAFLKYLLIELYENDSEKAPLSVIVELENLGSGLTIPSMKKGFHRVLGDAYLGYELSEEKAYEHLNAAYRIDSSVPETQLELMLSLADLAEVLGRKEEAIAVLQDFLKTARRDDRRGEVASRIATLSSE